MSSVRRGAPRRPAVRSNAGSGRHDGSAGRHPSGPGWTWGVIGWMDCNVTAMGCCGQELWQAAQLGWGTVGGFYVIVALLGCCWLLSTYALGCCICLMSWCGAGKHLSRG